MRQGQHSLVRITEAAHEAGYQELTYRSIGNGLRHAPADLHLPTVTSRFLRRRYETVARDFNSFEIMKDLTSEALNRLGMVDEELDDPDLTEGRRALLESKHWEWSGRAFNWARQCSELAVKMNTALLEHGGQRDDQADGDDDQQDAQSYLVEVVTEFNRLRPPVGDIVDEYGAENVRLPGEGRVTDEDEEDDY